MAVYGTLTLVPTFQPSKLLSGWLVTTRAVPSISS